MAGGSGPSAGVATIGAAPRSIGTTGTRTSIGVTGSKVLDGSGGSCTTGASAGGAGAASVSTTKRRSRSTNSRKAMCWPPVSSTNAPPAVAIVGSPPAPSLDRPGPRGERRTGRP